jgi:hypothetical protein
VVLFWGLQLVQTGGSNVGSRACPGCTVLFDPPLLLCAARRSPGIAQDASQLQREMARLQVQAARAGAAAGQEVDTAIAAVRRGLPEVGPDESLLLPLGSRRAVQAAGIEAALAHVSPPQASEAGGQLARAREDLARAKADLATAVTERCGAAG